MTAPARPPGRAGRAGPRAVRPPPLWPLAVVIVLTVLPELVLFLADRGLVGSPRWRILAWQYGGFWAGLLQGWRPNFAAQPATMFVTHAFLHAGPVHMLGNVLTLALLGPSILGRFGTRGFLAIYAAAILGGALAFAALTTGTAPMVGASGAIFGLVGAWTWMQGADRVRSGAGPVMAAAQVAGIVAALVLLNLAMWFLAHGVLAWETHLGGFLAGAGVAALIAPAPRPQPAG